MSSVEAVVNSAVFDHFAFGTPSRANGALGIEAIEKSGDAE